MIHSPIRVLRQCLLFALYLQFSVRISISSITNTTTFLSSKHHLKHEDEIKHVDVDQPTEWYYWSAIGSIAESVDFVSGLWPA